MAKQLPNDFKFDAPEIPDIEKLVTPLDKGYDPKDQLPNDPTKPGAFELPLPGAGEPPVLSEEDILSNLNKFSDVSKTTVNPAVRTKSQEFGAGMDHHQFERYYNMPRVYSKLGFTPFRDNEAAYNRESNFLDEFSRSYTQWGTVAGLGFKDALGFGSLTDTGVAKEYEKAMGIGSSSKGGVGGFINNLYLNSGYTMGIIAEVALEEVALGAITAATLGTTAELTVPTMIARGIRAGNKLHQAYNASKNVQRTMNAVQDVNKARQYFQKALGKAGKFVNPLENTMEFVQGVDKLDNLSDLALTTQGFANFYRDVRNIKLAWGEAGLEGGMVRNDVEKALLEEHMAKNNGRPPSKEEAMAIKETALQAGTTTGWQNVGAIYFSNKIVFDNLFNNFKPIRRLTEDALEMGINGRIVRNNKAIKSPWEYVENTWKNKAKAFADPKSYAKTGLNYFRANIAEGLQETAQEVIGGSASDYYKEEWRGTATKGGYFAAIADNLKKQMTPEGAEIFLSGFLMGGMIQPVTKAMNPSYLKNTWQKYTDPAAYKEAKAQKEEYINKTVNDLNELWNNLGEALEPDLDNLSRQAELSEGMQRAQENSDGKAYYDLKNQSRFEHIWTALKTGKFDTFIERLEGEKNLSAEEIAERYPDVDPAEYLDKIDSNIAVANRIKQNYENASDKLKNPFNPNQFKKGSERYYTELDNQRGWEEAIKKLVFMQDSFSNYLERMQSVMGEAQKDAKLANVPQSEFNTLFNFNNIDNEIKLLETEIKGLEGTSREGTESLKILKEKQKKLKLLKAFDEAMVAVRSGAVVEGTESTLDVNNPENKKALSQAKKAYKNYLKYLAEVNNDYAFDDALDNSFDKLVDYYMMDNDVTNLNKHINTLINPKAFVANAQREATYRKLRRDNMQTELRESLEAFIKAKETNDLLQLLYDKGVFVQPDAVKALIDEGKMPADFFKVQPNSKDEIEPVKRNSKLFRDAQEIIKNYMPNVMDINITEAQPNPYDSRTRDKFEDDKRTYKDLAAQFGFDPTAAETTLPLKQVLTTIINSEYATESEKALAEELLKKASDAETVKFVNNASNPGTYSPATQTTIDARYSSAEYRQGGLPIEHVILHEEIHRRTVDALQSDPEFNRKISDLLEKARTYFKENTQEGTRPFYGLKDENEFVAEAMSNARFQMFLALIPVDEASDATVWTKFVDAVLDALEAVFGTRVSNTVLNEALDVITSKIDIEFATKEIEGTQEIDTTTEPTAAPRQVVTSEEVMVTKNTPLEEIANGDLHPGLASTLVNAYRDFNNQALEEGRGGVAGVNEMAQDQILALPAFKSFLNSQSAKAIFDEYNERTNRTVNPDATAISSGEITIMSSDMIAELTRRGYNPANLSMAEAQAIIADPTRTKQQDDIDALATGIQSEVQEQAREVHRNRILELIDSQTTIDGLDSVVDELDKIDDITGLSYWDLTGLTAAELDPLIEAKKNELAFAFEFEDIRPRMTIILNTGEKVFVDNVENDVIYATKVNDPTKKRRIKKATVKERVKYIFKNEMLDPDIQVPTEEISDAANELSNQSQETADEMADNVEEFLNDYNTEQSDEEIEDDWLNNINECD